MESAKTLSLKLLDGYDMRISLQILNLDEMLARLHNFDWGGILRFPGLRGAAYFCCVGITGSILEKNNLDLQRTKFDENTAVAWASTGGMKRL